jgi:NTE family protein
VLEEEGIPIHLITGTSMGAVIGAMYAQNPNALEVMHRLGDYLKGNDYESLGLKYIVPQNGNTPSVLAQFMKTIARRIVINYATSRTGLVKSERLSNAIAVLIDEMDIRNTKIPFVAVATDLNSGETVSFREGSLRSAVRMSSSIPGYISPEELNGKLITDGGVSAPVPVETARELGADVVIGVSVGVKNVSTMKDAHILDIVNRTDTIRGMYLSRLQLSLADVGLHPDVKDAHWSEFLRFEDFISAGVEETRKKLPEIRRALKMKQGFFGRMFSIVSS